MSEQAVNDDPTLRLVRGHYYDFAWGEQPHWWTVRPDGTIFDPTALQFPSAGKGVYIEFDGNVNCSNCDKGMKEEEAMFDSNYCFCSNKCYGQFVGVDI